MGLTDGPGFEVPSTGTVLKFPENSKYPGLEVTVDEAPVGVLLGILEDFGSAGKGAKAMAALLRSVIPKFATILESWNATRKGEPVPPTQEGLESLGAAFVIDVINAWLTGKTTAGDDLGKDSPSGASSPEELTAAAALSSSLPSSSQQKF